MSASAVIDQARAAGVRLYVEDGRLCCEGEDSALDALESVLRAHKAELLAMLTGADMEKAGGDFWRVTLTDGRVFTYSGGFSTLPSKRKREFRESVYGGLGIDD